MSDNELLYELVKERAIEHKRAEIKQRNKQRIFDFVIKVIAFATIFYGVFFVGLD